MLLAFRQSSRNHREAVKIANESIISKKLNYIRKSCEVYPIDCSQQLYKNFQCRV